jgi:hypothetical protein
LAAHFFTERSAGLPVLFLVDDEVLGEIYSGASTDAVASLTDVVCRRLDGPASYYGYFHGVARTGREWRRSGANGDPPFLDLLAVCVLAATRMGTGNYAQNNYYGQLRVLLEINEGGMPRGFDDSLDAIWDIYTWWLDEHLEGARGLSTVITNAPFMHVGRPKSQTLFVGSDIARLDDFFRWIQLVPHEEVDPDYLVLYFRAWAPEQGLSAGARQLMEHEEFWPMLGGILAGYAHHWDGTRSDRVGNRTVELHVVVQLQFPKGVSLRSPQPDGYPEQLYGQLGGLSASAVARDMVFAVEQAIDPRYLRGDGALGDAASRLKFGGSDLYVLRLNPDLGGWASVSAFVPGERHCVLAAPAVADNVRQQLMRWSTEPVNSQRAPGPFAAWTLFSDVVLQGEEALEGVLAEKRTTLRHRFAFRGGLPLEARWSYLSGGAPDVWLPPTTEQSLWVTLDGERVNTLEDIVRLADFLPAEETASHIVGYGGVISRHIAMIGSSRLLPPEHDQPAHVIEVDADGLRIAHAVVARVEDAPDAAIEVVGPHVRGAADDWTEPPLLLRRRADCAWLLGREPTEVLVVDKPTEPSWMKKRRLHGQLYEARAPFPVQYSVEWWPSGKRLARQRGNLDPGELTVEGRAGMWAELLLGAELVDGDPGAWADYLAAAEAIEEQIGQAPALDYVATTSPPPTYLIPPYPGANGYEQLLHWMAERGSGDFGEFEAAHAWATAGDTPWRRTLRLLATLGYIEIDWRGRQWGAVSPTITLLPEAGGYGLVVGARTARLTAALNAVDEPDVYVDPKVQDFAPDVCFVAADTETALEQLAGQVGLRFVHSVTERLADILPPLDAMLLPYEQPDMVQHYGVERFTLDDEFVPVEDDTGPGFYRYEVSGPRRMQFADDGGMRYAVDEAVGKWAEARRVGATNLLDWKADGTNGELLTPWMLPLPVLQARAAALCSGLPPPYDRSTGEVVYVNVPEWLAVRIAESLGQLLEYVANR